MFGMVSGTELVLITITTEETPYTTKSIPLDTSIVVMLTIITVIVDGKHLNASETKLVSKVFVILLNG